MVPSPDVTDALAVPIDFAAGRGDGLRFGVSYGGGGIFFVAWQAAYLHALAVAGLDIGHADRAIGTSAGSVVASINEAGHLARFEREVSFFARTPALVSALAPAGKLASSQQRALDLFVSATDADPSTIRAIGHAALAADTPTAAKMARSVSLLLLSRRWPSRAVHTVCVDAVTGERCVVGVDSGVRIDRAVAASSAVPGIFAPQPIGDRRCMDGGVSGSGTHLDLLAGADRVMVLTVHSPNDRTAGGMTQRSGALAAELSALEGSGSKVFHQSPETVDLRRLMDPRAVPDAIAMARRQAAADVTELRSFLRRT